MRPNPTRGERLASIFRAIHSIKGACGFLGFSKLEAVAHAGENLLSRLRDGRLTLTPDIASALLALVDALRRMLGHIERTGHESEEAHAGLIATLTRLCGEGEASHLHNCAAG